MNRSFQNSLRVRYGETDQMGFVYYGNYPLYLEVARTELLRSLELSYAEMESQGIQLPVVNLNIDYRNAAKYDDLLTISTTIINEINKKICFKSEITNEEGKLICEASVTLVFVNTEKGRVMSCPEALRTKLETYQWH